MTAEYWNEPQWYHACLLCIFSHHKAPAGKYTGTNVKNNSRAALNSSFSAEHRKLNVERICIRFWIINQTRPPFPLYEKKQTIIIISYFLGLQLQIVLSFYMHRMQQSHMGDKNCALHLIWSCSTSVQKRRGLDHYHPKKIINKIHVCNIASIMSTSSHDYLFLIVTLT